MYVVAGKFVRGYIRDKLNYLKFIGDLEDFIEEKSFSQSTFTLKNPGIRTTLYVHELSLLKEK